MASRTQLRLQQLTGSLDDTKARAGSINETSLQGVLDHVAASIQRIHGGSVFQDQEAGHFDHNLHITGSGIDFSQASEISTAAGSLTLTGSSVQLRHDAGTAVEIRRNGSVQLKFEAGTAQNDTAIAINANNALEFKEDGGSVFAEIDTNLNAIKMYSTNPVIFNDNGLNIHAKGTTNLVLSGTLVEVEEDVAIRGGSLQIDGTAQIKDASGHVRIEYGDASSLLIKSQDGSANLATFADTSSTFAQDATFSADVTVNGNLNVIGVTSTIDSQNLQVEDTVILLGSGSSGEGVAGDRGLIMAIASETNPAMFWDESEDQFAFVRTNAEADSNTITTDAYANLKVAALYVEQGIALPDSAADHHLLLAADSDDLSADRNLVFRLDDADRELILSGNLTVEAASRINQDVTSDASVTFGDVTANGGVVVDNITIDGQEIDVSSGDLTLDVAGNIALNADGGNVTIEDAASTLFTFAANEIDVASGDLLLDVAGDIILNADGADIFFDDATARFGSISMLGGNNMLALSSSAGNSIALMSQAGTIMLSNADGSVAGSFDLGTADTVKVLDSTDRERIHLDASAGDGFTMISGSFKLDNGADPAEIIFKDAGSNELTLELPASITAYDLVLPDDKGTVGQVLKIDSVVGSKANLTFGDALGDLAKGVKIIAAQVSAGDAVNFNSVDAGDTISGLQQSDAQGKSLDVFVNGQLLVSGSATARAAGTRDYEIFSATELKFAFNLEVDDIVQLIKR